MKLLLLAVWLLGDIVTLKSGGTIEGIAKEVGDKIVVETGAGTITIPMEQVATIEKKPHKLQEYNERYEKIKDSKDPKDFYELARWAKQHKITKHVTPLLSRVLELDPSHEMARRSLGFTLYQGKWLTDEELKVAQGMLKFEGKWVTKEERAGILAYREKKKELENQIAILKAELAKSRAPAREPEPEFGLPDPFWGSGYSSLGRGYSYGSYYPYYRGLQWAWGENPYGVPHSPRFAQPYGGKVWGYSGGRK